MTVQHLIDLLRYGVLCEIALSVGFVLGGLFKHRPTYLKLLAIAYILYSIAAADLLVIRLHQPLTWRLPLLFVAATISLAAQYVQKVGGEA